jgi:hypothetical protein
MVDKKRYKFVVVDFFPFIGVLYNDKNLKKVENLLKRDIVTRYELDDGNDKFQDQFKRQCIKLYLKNTRLVRMVKYRFKITFQADVPYIRVFRTTKGIHSGFVIKNYEEVLSREKMGLQKHGVKLKKYYDDYILLRHDEVIGF